MLVLLLVLMGALAVLAPARAAGGRLARAVAGGAGRGGRGRARGGGARAVGRGAVDRDARGGRRPGAARVGGVQPLRVLAGRARGVRRPSARRRRAPAASASSGGASATSSTRRATRTRSTSRRRPSSGSSGCCCSRCAIAGVVVQRAAPGGADAGRSPRSSLYAVHAGLDWDWEMPALTLVALLIAGALSGRAGTGGLSARARARARRGERAGRPCARSGRAAATRRGSRARGGRSPAGGGRRGRAAWSNASSWASRSSGSVERRAAGGALEQPVAARDVLRLRAHGGDPGALVADRAQPGGEPDRDEQRGDDDGRAGDHATRASRSRAPDDARARCGPSAATGQHERGADRLDGEHGAGERVEVVRAREQDRLGDRPRPRARRRTSAGAGRAGTGRAM